MTKRRATTVKSALFLKNLQKEGVDIDTGDQGAAPQLFFDALPLWNAFSELSPSRSAGFSIGRIPYSEVTCWLTENRIHSLEERQHYRKFISFIDELWVSHMSAKMESKKK